MYTHIYIYIYMRMNIYIYIHTYTILYYYYYIHHARNVNPGSIVKSRQNMSKYDPESGCFVQSESL